VRVIEGEDAPKVYQHKLVLIRTDQHVAWRGNVLPDDQYVFIDVLWGART
jgi:hypothetical protein